MYLQRLKNASASRVVGSVVGAIAGALIGLATESGLLPCRGAGTVAISGAVFSVELVESSLDLWNSREPGIWSILYLCNIAGISIDLSCRYPYMDTDNLRTQMSALGFHFMESTDLFEVGGGVRGLSSMRCDAMLKTMSTPQVVKIWCSVCLQVEDCCCRSKVLQTHHA
ncbi:hypothetical protein B296_00022653 [Ensete ventricosum]|uniref:Uncharacterized protein n=1 Tax=Ensete ventricosum TaxID=4639 RepID=A0A427A3R5_ENSVE|nr:hypothetical protein B296_00022653 [Ensete ventricosum]